jgi:hypothetical protein
MSAFGLDSASLSRLKSGSRCCGDVAVHDLPQALDGVEVEGVGGQEDQPSAASGRASHSRTGGAVWVAALSRMTGSRLPGFAASSLTRSFTVVSVMILSSLTMRKLPVSRQSAPARFIRRRPLPLRIAVRTPRRTQPSADRPWYSRCTASAK